MYDQIDWYAGTLILKYGVIAYFQVVQDTSIFLSIIVIWLSQIDVNPVEEGSGIVTQLDGHQDSIVIPVPIFASMKVFEIIFQVLISSIMSSALNVTWYPEADDLRSSSQNIFHVQVLRYVISWSRGEAVIPVNDIVAGDHSITSPVAAETHIVCVNTAIKIVQLIKIILFIILKWY